MDLRQLITLFRRWFWYLVLGLFVGLVVGYLGSKIQKPVYEVSTKIMISRQAQEENPDFAGLNSFQLVQTYIQLLDTTLLLDETSERVGVEIDPKKVVVQQVPDTQIIEIKVEDSSAEEAVSIANTMVQVLTEQNEGMQAGQYEALENRLTLQVEKIKEQIEFFQKEYDQAYDQEYLDQLAVVDEQVGALQSELSSLQDEMSVLNPAYNDEDQTLMDEMQMRVDQIQSMVGIYEEIRANLLILGRPMLTSSLQVSPRLQQLQSTVDLYQNLYLTLVEDLEKVRLARLQETPNIVQIEEAFIPEKPAHPIPLLYTLISGVVGLTLTLGIAFFLEALKDDLEPIKDVVQGGRLEKAMEMPVLSRKKAKGAVKAE